MAAMPIDIGLSESDTKSFAQNNPTTINTGDGSSVVIWVIVGTIVILGLVVWLKLKGKR